MQKRYPIVIAIVLILGLTALFRYGSTASPVTVIEPGQSDSLSGIGTVIYESLKGSVDNEPLVIFGVSPTDPSHKLVVEEFISRAQIEAKGFAVVFREKELPQLNVPAGTEVIDADFNSSPFELAKLVREKVQDGRKALFYTVNIFSSHLLTQNPIQRFEQEWGKEIPSITSIGIGLAREQEYRMSPPCMGSERDGQGTSVLGCTALHKQRSLYRRGFDVQRTAFMMDEQSPADYLLFLYQPEVPAASAQ